MHRYIVVSGRIQVGCLGMMLVGFWRRVEMAFGLGSGYALQHCSLRSSSSWSGVEGPPWNKRGGGGQLTVLVLMPAPVCPDSACV